MVVNVILVWWWGWWCGCKEWILCW